VKETADGLTFGAAELLTDVERMGGQAGDPSVLPDGWVVFHLTTQGGRARLGLMDGSGNEFRALTDADGSGHVSVNPSGTRIAFSRSGTGAALVAERNGTSFAAAVPLNLPRTGKEMAVYDERYAGCAKVHFSYLQWLDDDTLLASAHGSSGENKFSLSGLFIVDLVPDGPAKLWHLSGAIEKHEGLQGRDFCTGCLVPAR